MARGYAAQQRQPTLGRRAGGPVGLVGLGLAFFIFPTMWNEVDGAF